MQPTIEEFVRLAHAHRGYFTAAEAGAAGISRRSLTHHASTGTLHRVAHGIYRLPLYPDPHPMEDVVVAALWAGVGSAISHQSALALHGLGERPPVVHVTTPTPFRGRREGVVVHCQRLGVVEIVAIDTVAVTTVERALVDVATADPDLARTAVRLALTRGLTSIERLEASLGGTNDGSAHAALLDAAVLGAAPSQPHAGGRRRPGPATPSASNAFIGRDDELDRLESLLSASRLLTLTGPPGVGKSRLANELVSRVADRYPDAVSVVQLALVNDASLVPAAVANALSVWEQPGRSATEVVVDYLAPLSVLLVLDNCEHLVVACAALAEHVLGCCPHVSVLTTTQVPMDLAEEQTWVVQPLAVPQEGDGPEEVAASESVRLFCQRAAAARPGFHLDEEETGAVADICRSLDGLPLAIELAAARVAVLTPSDIVARLGTDFGLLATDDESDLPRHRTMRATLEWSHNLLPADEQVLLRRLSVFVGGFTLAAIEAVCAGEAGGPRLSVLDSLASLVAKSLVSVDTSGRHARYRMLEPIRLFAAERLAEAGEVAAVTNRHGRWFTAVAVEEEPGLSGAEQIRCLDRLDADHDNLRAALRWAVDGGHGDEALQLAGSLALFWRVRGYFAEGRRWLEAALALPQERTGSKARTQALWGASLLALMVGDPSAALRFGEESLQLARQNGDLRAQARTLLVLGNAHLWPEPEVALGILEEAADLARQADDQWCLAHSLGLIGRGQIDQGDTKRAHRTLVECVSVAQAAHDEQSLRLGLCVLGDLALARGSYPEAARFLEQSLEVARALAEPYAISVALGSLGQLAMEKRQWDRATELQMEALGLARRAGSADGTAGAMLALGELASEAGHSGAAHHWYQQTMEVLSKAGANLAAPVQRLGELAVVEGDLAGGRRLLEEAVRLARASNTKSIIASALTALGNLEYREGNFGQAATCHLEALELRYRTEQVPRLFVSFGAVALASGAHGHTEYAARLLGAAGELRRRHTGNDSPGPGASEEPEVLAIVEALGRERYEALRAEGAAISLAKAVAYARRGRDRSRPSKGWSSLTDTQRRVAELVAEGHTDAQIAEHLFISPRTVGAHVRNIFSKLDVSSRSQVATHRPPSTARSGS
ncbi:MAG TPA: tetratricopeptide repeat protein [Acidimicrobiales bacterium]|nr:tetratricopeptide repeat protein [Acidimicrobiales bacterium]